MVTSVCRASSSMGNTSWAASGDCAGSTATQAASPIQWIAPRSMVLDSTAWTTFSGDMLCNWICCGRRLSGRHDSAAGKSPAARAEIATSLI